MTNEPKVDAELTDRVAEMLLDGESVTAVCDEVGISRSSFYRYRRLGKRGFHEGSETDVDDRYVNFYARTQNAIARRRAEEARDMMPGDGQ